MILVVGGRAQGKCDFVKNCLCRGKEELKIADAGTASWKELKESQVIDKFHLLVKRILKGELQPDWDLFSQNPGCIVISDEVGCGIVPVDAFERQWRELTGRACCQLAEQAEQVWRVTCGLGQRIK